MKTSLLIAVFFLTILIIMAAGYSIGYQVGVASKTYSPPRTITPNSITIR